METWESPNRFAEHLLDAHNRFAEDRVSLTGKWRFFTQSADAPLPDGWEKPDYSDKKWKRVAIPGSWDSFLVESGDTAGDIGLFRRSFILSRDQGSRQIFLRLCAAGSCVAVWVNGTYIGMARDCMTCMDFDITSAVRPDKNFVCIQVRKRNALNAPSKYPIDGIPGDVQLYTLPFRRISAILPTVRWNGNTPDTLELNLLTRNADGFTARIALMDDRGVIGYSECGIQNGAASAQLSCRDVALWNPESPHLYRIAVILWDGVAMYHTCQVEIGFRKIDLDDTALRVNSSLETVRAVDYHPEHNGSILSVEEMERDLLQLRAHNFNAVFVTGFLPVDLASICDRIGLYLIHSCGFSADDSAIDYVDFQHERIHAALIGHPSVLLLDRGSETSGIPGLSLLTILSDPSASQLAQFCGASDSAPEKSGAWFGREKTAPGAESETRKPVLVRLSRIEDLAKLHSTLKPASRLCGVVFGSYRDHGNQVGFVESDGTPRPALRTAKSLFQPFRCIYENDMLTIENRSTFLSSDHIRCEAVLTCDGTEVFRRQLPLHIAPGESIRIPMETKYDIYRPGRYYLSVEFFRNGQTSPVSFEQWSVAHLKHIYDENAGGTIREDDGSILLRSRNASYRIHRSSGQLEHIRLDERDLLVLPVNPIYTDDASAKRHPLLADEWEKLTLRRKKLKPSVLEVDHMTRTVTASFHLGSGLMQTCRLYADGSLAIELRLRTGRTAPDRIGMELLLPDGFRHLEWLGHGPDGNEKNGFFGIHSQAVTQNIAAKICVYSMRLSDDSGVTLHLRSEEGMNISLRSTAQGTRLTLDLMTDEPPKPHATYLLAVNLRPEQA